MPLRTENDAEALVAALLDGEDPKDFLKRTAPGIDAAKGNHHVAAYELEDIGIDNSQYFQGRGTSYTDWTEVYVGVGDNPAEAISDALDSAAQSGWLLPDVLTQEADAWPEMPSVSADAQAEAAQQAAEELDRADYEDDEKYKAAVEERTEEMMGEGDSDMYYHAAVWLREPSEGEPILTAHQESEDPKAVFRRLGNLDMPSTWPRIPRWQKDSRWGRERERRRGFYTATRHRAVYDPQGGGYTHSEPYEVRKGLPHTRFYRDRSDSSHWVEYYSTNILTWDRLKTCTVDNGGHWRVTTRDRMNQFLPHGWRIHTFRSNWYWFNNQWPENIRDRLWADQAARRAPIYPWWIPYHNGDFIKHDGTLNFGGGSGQGGKNGMAKPDGALKTEQDASFRPVPVGPQTMPRRARRDPYGRDPRQLRFQLEGKYLRNLDHWKRVKAKHERMKEVGKLQRELEKVDKPDDRKKPKKGHQHIR